MGTKALGELQMDLMDAFPAYVGEKKSYEGFIKVKLVHARGFSVLLPDLVFAEIDGWRWFQPQYFSPCLLSFQDDAVYAQLNVDTDNGARLFVGFTGDRRPLIAATPGWFKCLPVPNHRAIRFAEGSYRDLRSGTRC